MGSIAANPNTMEQSTIDVSLSAPTTIKTITNTVKIIAIITPKAGKADRVSIHNKDERILADDIQVEELLVAAAEKVKANEPGTLKYHLQKETKGDAPTFVMLET
jgi:hypothetical protein